MCGVGWRYVHSPFEELVDEKGQAEIVTEVAIRYRCQEKAGGCQCSPVPQPRQRPRRVPAISADLNVIQPAPVVVVHKPPSQSLVTLRGDD